MTTSKGIDISNWQSTTPEGYAFYIMKATEGIGYKDARLDQHYRNAKGYGVPVGFYHFARPDLGNSAEKEAAYFLETLGDKEKGAVLALDLECANYGRFVSWARDWCEYVIDKTGKRPLLYVPGAHAQKFAKMCNDLNIGVWAPSSADYYKGMSIVMTQTIQNGLDIDFFYGTVEQFKKYGDGSTGAATSTTRKMNEEIALEVIAGKWGNGEDRKKRLTDAGYDYATVQAIVNEKSAGTATYYTIQKGDTLTAIANKYGTTVAKIKSMNPDKIKNVNLIYPGVKIRVK